MRLLRVEYGLYSHLGDAARMYMRLRSFLDRLRGGRGGGRDPLQLIEEWRGLARSILDFLSSDSHRLVLVSTADRLSAAVTRRLVEEFRGQGIEPRALIVNMLLGESLCPDCPVLREDRAEQAEALRELGGLGVRVYQVPRLARRPRGVGELRVLARRLGELVDVLVGGL